MKTILDEFERKTIEVWARNRIQKFPAWCYGELFTTSADNLSTKEKWWQIGCIPRGSFFPNTSLGMYSTIENACAAIKEMARINNSWASTTTFTDKQLDQLKAVCDKFGGNRDIIIVRGGQAVPPHALPNMNGADAANYQ